LDVFSATRGAQQNISLRSDTTAVLIMDMLHDFCDPAGAMNEITITDDEKTLSDSVQGEVRYDLQRNIGYLLRATNQYAVSRFNSYMKNAMLINHLCYLKNCARLLR
jgi:putative salt-induced outer membrane protein YdiY